FQSAIVPSDLARPRMKSKSPIVRTNTEGVVMRNLVSRTRFILLGAMALGIMLTVSSDRAAGDDCGPALNWNCVLPRCQECPEISFSGTVCQKQAFEQQTGRVCTQE